MNNEFPNNVVLQLIELGKQASTLRASIDVKAKERIIEYSKAERLRYPHGESPTQTDSITEWHVDGDHVSYQWSETWNFGGHASGSDEMPSNFLYDEVAFAAFVEECKQIAENKKVQQQNEKLAEDQREFERLKQKLGKP